MFPMRVDQRRKKRDNVPLSIEGCVCLEVLSIMRGCVRNRCLLKYNPKGIIGGAVVPPCDFHLQSSSLPDFKGIPP